ncbi:MAG TPA: response regulator [Hanamia sp.]
MEKCILIYEDDLEISTVTKIILEKKKYRVEIRTRCDDIIKEVNAINPDLVFMDLWIPTIGGERALQILKQNEATRNVPVILFSAHDLIKEVSQRTNADGYLKKPFTIDELLKIVDKAISKKK